MKNVFKKKLGVQIFLLFLVLMVFSLGSLSLSVFNSTSSILLGRQEEYNARILRMTRLYIQNLYSKMSEYTDLVYGNPEIQRILNADWDSLSELEQFRSLRVIEMEFLLPMMRANREFDSIWVLREGARSFGSAQFLLRDRDFQPEEWPWFSQLEDQTSRPFHYLPTRPAEYDANQNLVFSVARWLPNLQITRTGPRYLGIVVLNVHLSALEEALNLYSSQVDNSSFMMILDGNDRVMAHPDRSMVGKSWSELGRSNVGFEPGVTQGQFVATNNRGYQEMVSWLVTETTGWRLLTVTPYDVILSDIRNLGLWLALLSLATLLFAAFLASLISWRISRPIAAMKDMMARVEDGDLSARYHTRSEHEIGQLSRSLNRMMDELEQKTENLLELDRMKDEFLASTSHELRTPLNGIMGLAEFLLDGGAGSLNPEQGRNLQVMLKSSRRLANLVSDILDYSQLKKQKLVLQTQAVDLFSAAAASLDVVAPLARNKGLSIAMEIPRNLPAVQADPNRLEQIFLNLLANAIKFTEKGQVALKARIQDGQALISIEDTGIGIPADKLERVFNDFEQVESTSTRRFGGTGLGLSICRKFVELHGGLIWCESRLDVGSSFHFTLPLAEGRAEPLSGGQNTQDRAQKGRGTGQEAPGAEAPPAAPRDKVTAPQPLGAKTMDVHLLPEQNEIRPYRILAVDDEPLNLQVLEIHLKRYNYEVVLAASGMQALEILAQDQVFDLVILDIMMPLMSGFEVCQEIRKGWTLYDLPVLLLTAKNQAEDIVQGFQSGANDYLIKPFDRAELLARAKTMVTLKRKVHDALVTAESLESEREQRQLAETLRSSNKRLSDSLSREGILQTLLAVILELVPFDCGSAFVRAGSFLTPLPGCSDPDTPLNPAPISLDSNFLVPFFTGESEYSLVDNPKIDSVPVILSSLSATSLLVPLVLKGSMEGLLVLEARAEGFFNQQYLSFILTLASQAQSSLSNALLYEEVRTLADLDPLTGLNNRRSFVAKAERELKLTKRNRMNAAVLLFDIDHFKSFNDTHGHDVGDLVLKAVAETSVSCLRETDILGRFGGEEFIVLLPPESGTDNALLVAERLRRAIEENRVDVPEFGSLQVTVSMGLASTENQVYDLKTLTKWADEAMYEAKKAGRNCIRSKGGESVP